MRLNTSSAPAKAKHGIPSACLGGGVEPQQRFAVTGFAENRVSNVSLSLLEIWSDRAATRRLSRTSKSAVGS